MKIAVIGATGKSGNLIVQEALSRGHEVTAIVRDARKLGETKVNVLEKDLFDLTFDDLQDQDVIIDAFAAWTPDTLVLHQTSLKYLADVLSGKPNRLLVVGGAGSLYVNPEHTVRLLDTPDFPDAYKALASNMGKGLDALKLRSDVNWTYVSPAAAFVADGERTGSYKAGGEELIVNSQGESVISYADYAIAMIDEAENGNHIRARFTVVSK
ncbi:NAD(P)-dependent oxidoreductase [Paenibacillus albiflavus]|uniref:NAD(P)-dependent oxidoreductase n=1 Tax=Paenibacillus albiflavus TaxID=2545760 RepID=A0A4R4EKA5_9BACL|nr:NAD(P)-dependent oxidoreductase [Paenibacillus albiflavus]TCZ79883.1 NAD(P)-dependent oxidoreductase [Paenibacillus albiflavus]